MKKLFLALFCSFLTLQASEASTADDKDGDLPYRLQQVFQGAKVTIEDFHTLKIGNYEAHSLVAASPDGNHIVTRDNHNIIVTTTATTMATQKRCDDINSIAFNHTGDCCATAAGSEITLWNPATLESSTLYNTFDINDVQWSPDSQQIAAIEQGAIVVWDVPSQLRTQRIVPPVNIGRFAFFSANESVCIAAYSQYHPDIFIYDSATANSVLTINLAQGATINDFACDEDCIGVAYNHHCAPIFQLQRSTSSTQPSKPNLNTTLLMHNSAQPHNGNIKQIVFCQHNNNLVATLSNGPHAYLWDRQGNQLAALQLTEKIYTISFSPSDDLIALAGKQMVKVVALPDVSNPVDVCTINVANSFLATQKSALLADNILPVMHNEKVYAIQLNKLRLTPPKFRQRTVQRIKRNKRTILAVTVGIPAILGYCYLLKKLNNCSIKVT